MPSPVHDLFIRDVENNITRQLESIGRGHGEAARFAQAVQAMRSSRVYLEFDESNSKSPCTKRDPDASFKHRKAKFPGLVLEIAYSQKGLELWDLAEDYLLGSKGNIKVMVGLGIAYGASQKATFSTWRPQYVMNGIRNELRAVPTIQSQVGAPSQASRQYVDFD